MHKTSLLFGVAAAALSFALSTASFADEAAEIKAKAEDYTKTQVAQVGCRRRRRRRAVRRQLVQRRL